MIQYLNKPPRISEKNFDSPGLTNIQTNLHSINVQKSTMQQSRCVFVPTAFIRDLMPEDICA